MKVAVLGDLHLGRSLYGYDTTPHTRRVMYQFLNQAKRWGVTRAVQLGDVGDSPVWPLAQQKFVVQWCNEFERWGIALYLMVGNHDVTSRPGATSALDFVRAVPYKHVRVIDRPCFVDGMLFLPFPSPSLYASDQEWQGDVAQAVHEVGAKSDVTCFAHLNIDGAKLGEQEWEYRGGDYGLPLSELPDNIDEIVCGHIHKPQRVGRALVLGAAQRLRFSECSNRPRILLHNNVGRSRTVDIEHAIRLVEFSLEASRWTGVDASAYQIASDLIESENVRGAVVKLSPLVDRSTEIEWRQVEQELYAAGAAHVTVAPRVIEREETRKERTTHDPTKLAASFIKERVRSKQDRNDLRQRFKRLRGQDGDRAT